jgi:alpha-glucosidase
VPLPWTRELPPRSWLPQPASWAERSVEAQLEDGDSFLTLYRRALELRPAGGFAWLDSPPGSLVFERRSPRDSPPEASRGQSLGRGPGTVPRLVCAVNVGSEPFALPERDLLLASESIGDTLPRGAAAWLTPSVEH